MARTTPDERRRLESLAAEALAEHQLARLNRLLDEILPANRFYAQLLAGIQRPLRSLEDLAQLPYTYKESLAGSRQQGDLAANLTFPREAYVRFHQTSGTRGRPLVVLDTAEDWQWWIDCWQYVLDAAGVSRADSVFLAFAFGPFIGFWSAYDALAARGCLVVPGGGLGTVARLELIRSSRATVVCCTPSYALHLAEVAAERHMALGDLPVRMLILAGEPGGSIPAVRARIAGAWRAQVLDHAGATEVGPWGYGDDAGRGLHVLESEFVAEFLSVETGRPAAEGELAELVLTGLGRPGCPVLRYRTGDLVRPIRRHELANRFVLLEGGVVGRSDDMLVIRGVNIFPSSVDEIVRGFPEVVEYRLIVRQAGALDQLAVEIEDRLDNPRRVAEELRLRLGLKIDVTTVPPGSLPRYEAKGQRFVDLRGSQDGA